MTIAKDEMNRKIYGLYKISNITRDACIELIGHDAFIILDNPPPPPAPPAPPLMKYSFVSLKTKVNPEDIKGWSNVVIVRNAADEITYSFMTDPCSKMISMGRLKEMLERVVSETTRETSELSVGFLNNRFEDIIKRDDIQDVIFLTLQTFPYALYYERFADGKFTGKKLLSDWDRADVWQRVQMHVGTWNHENSPSTYKVEL